LLWYVADYDDVRTAALEQLTDGDLAVFEVAIDANLYDCTAQ